MKASIQQKIAPYTPPVPPSFNKLKVKEKDGARVDGDKSNKTSFRDLITNSMEEVKKKREAKKLNDFSDAKTDAEFLERLKESSMPKVKAKNKLDKNDFLKLFVAQMQHQDPLNPDNGAEMAAKLAQFNSVEQMTNVNTNLKKLLDAQGNSESLQLVNYVGKVATIEGGRINVSDKKTSRPRFAIEQDAHKATVQIRNSDGKTVLEKDIGTLKKGSHKIDWDNKDNSGNKVPNGLYSYSIIAKTIENKPIPVKITSKAKIEGIDLSNTDKTDNSGNLYTNIGKIKFEDILSIGNVGYDNNSKNTMTNLAIKAPNAKPLKLEQNHHTGLINTPTRQDNNRPNTIRLNHDDTAKKAPNLPGIAVKSDSTKNNKNPATKLSDKRASLPTTPKASHNNENSKNVSIKQQKAPIPDNNNKKASTAS